MSPREKRKQVFIDTMNWINEDPDLKQSIISSILKTKIYFENDYPELQRETKNTKIAVTKERTFEAVQRLKNTYPDAKIAAMNFANAFHPGGGVKSGAGAQEECLCRCSTLYPCIDIEEASAYYRHHQDLNSDLATDSLIYTPNVTVCKTDTDIPERMLKEQWYQTDIMTIAAPDLADITLSDQELYNIHFQRITHMLTVAGHENVDVLVLGAFGCGAFHNDPNIVSKAFHDAIAKFPHVFEYICFAVYCSDRDKVNYEAFMKTFS